MKVFDFFADLIFPPSCVSCGKLTDASGNGLFGTALCDECGKKVKTALAYICPECRRPLVLCRCMPKRLEDGGADLCLKCLPYRSGDEEDAVNRFIYHIKHQKDSRAFGFAAKLMSAPLMNVIGGEEVIFTYLPRRKSAIRRDGFDQAERLSEALAKICKGKCVKILQRCGGKEQKRLSEEDRAKNSEHSFALCKSADVRGKTVVIVDDIITTGSSLGAGANILKNAGAGRVICLSLAFTLKNNDKNT